MPLNIDAYLDLLSKYDGDWSQATEDERRKASQLNGRHALLAYRLAIKYWNKLPHEKNNRRPLEGGQGHE